jgi:hypothetical protein
MASVRQLCKSGVILENGCMKFNGSVGDAIDLYIKGNLLEDSDISYISNEKINQYRIKSDGTIHPVEILEVERISEARIDSTDELAFRLRLRNNESKQKLQICTLIDDIRTDNRVGLTCSKELDLSSVQSEFEVEIRIANTNLTKGQYKLNFWIGTGDIHTTMSYYDRIFDSLTFEVTSLCNKPISMWYDDWGFSYFENGSTKLLK